MTLKVTFAQSTPGSWSRVDILVNGVKQFVAVKTVGPGFWSIFDLEDENIGSGSNKSEIKSAVLDYLLKKVKKMTKPEWIPVTQELLNAQHEWLYKPMWVAIKDGPVTIGEYKWRQGRNPDRFVGVEYGDVWAFDATHVMEIIPPTHPSRK